MKNISNLKSVYAITLAISMLMFVVTSVQPQDLWVSQKGSIVYLGNSEACTAYEYFGKEKVANEKAQLATEASKQYNWPAKPFMQPGCNALKKAAEPVTPIKIWKVAVNQRYPDKTTRPTKNIVLLGNQKLLGTATKIRAVIGQLCGSKIKFINKRYEYREIKINNITYAAVCE